MNNIKNKFNEVKYALIAPLLALSIEGCLTGIEYIRGSPNPFATANLPFAMQYKESFEYHPDWSLEENAKQFKCGDGACWYIKK